MTEWLNRCHFGDVRAVLRRMAAAGVKVQTIVTSPPYWGLRSYLPAEHPDKVHEIGSEPTLREFIDGMVEVFDLCRDVLADDGTMWVNMGDSYASRPNGSIGATSLQGSTAPHAESRRAHALRKPGLTDGLKSKDLVGQPWRLAFALQDGRAKCSGCGTEHGTSEWPVHNGHRVCVACLIEGRESKVLPSSPGWYLRQDVIWAKPNPMPESIRDRCTKAHEYVFLLSKSERYFYDFDAMQEPVNGGAHSRRKVIPAGWAVGEGPHDAAGHQTAQQHPKAMPDPNVGRRVTKTNGVGWGYAEGADAKPRTRKLAEAGSGTKLNESYDAAIGSGGLTTTRNRRSVWTVPSEPFSGAHFATFPRALIQPCILAGAPVGGIVLDPFFGSGTTGQVAQQLGRQFIGIELNEANEPLQRERLRQPSLILEAAA